MIPTRRTLFLLLAGLSAALLPIYLGDRGAAIWLCYVCALGMALFVAPLLVRAMHDAQVSINCPDTLYLEGEDDITLLVPSPLTFAVPVETRLESTGAAVCEVVSVPPLLQPGENKFVYRVRPLRRGILELSAAVLRIQDFLGLWRLTYRFPLNKSAKMLPNLRGVSKYAIRFYSNPEARVGLKIEKYRGEGTEFDSMREYMPGCDIRRMDWKASARRAKLVYREVRAEQNHDIVLALDSGHLMAAEFKGLTKLDYAVNAILLLCYVAIKTSDRVGFLSFSDKVHTFLKPDAGVHTVERIANECAKLSYQFQPTNFVVAMEYLLAQQKRRALTIILTDFVDSISADLMKDYLCVLSRRHLVLFVSVRNPFLDTYVHEQPNGLLDMHKYVACYDMQDERSLLFRELQRMGIHWLDLFPTDISVPMLNRYLDIRRKELI
jgi:uncharacterized protein (DUF58 family)